MEDVPSVMSSARIPPTARFIECGGEALTQSAVDNVPDHVHLYNSYGPTEVTISSVAKLVDRTQLPCRLASIGGPMPNVTCYVVDPESNARSPLLQP
eukprot:1321184-Prymnesium_polylepis.1